MAPQKIYCVFQEDRDPNAPGVTHVAVVYRPQSCLAVSSAGAFSAAEVIRVYSGETPRLPHPGIDILPISEAREKYEFEALAI